MSERLRPENLTEEEIGDIMQNFIDEIFADSDSDSDSKEDNNICDYQLDVRIDREIFLDQVQVPDIPESFSQHIEKKPTDFSWYIPDFIEPVERIKFSGKTGIRQVTNLGTQMSENVVQFFEKFFTEDLLFILAEQTNIYAAQYEKILCTDSRSLRTAKWVDTNKMEIKRFLAATLLMGHIEKDSITEYWSTDKLVETPIFRKIMPRDRFLAILRYLHFNDNNFPRDKSNSDSDQLWKIRTIFNMLNRSFKEAYDPAEEVILSEVSMKFKVKTLFQQRILKKQKILGMKMSRILDKTGYTYHIEMHEGKDENREFTEAEAHALVMKMTKCIAGKGHKLYMDDSFSSPNLFKNLLEEYKINSCGLVRPNRKNFPKFFDKSIKGKTSVKCYEEMTALRWSDKINIYFLTNMHTLPIQSSSDTKEEKLLEKPEIVSDCYKHMGYADLSDYMMNSYTLRGRCLKWTKKIFFRLLDISVLNAFYLCKLENPDITFKSFRLTLIQELLSTTESCTPKLTSIPFKERCFQMPSSGHWPTEEKKRRRRCVVCSKSKGQQKRTTVSCIKCNVGLCIKDCFRDFHC